MEDGRQHGPRRAAGSEGRSRPLPTVRPAVSTPAAPLPRSDVPTLESSDGARPLPSAPGWLPVLVSPSAPWSRSPLSTSGRLDQGLTRGGSQLATMVTNVGFSYSYDHLFGEGRTGQCRRRQGASVDRDRDDAAEDRQVGDLLLGKWSGSSSMHEGVCCWTRTTT